MMIHTPGGRPLKMVGGDIFSDQGLHLARVVGTIAYTPSGRYAGSLEGQILLFSDADCMCLERPFVPLSDVGFTSAWTGNGPSRSREPRFG